VWRRLLLLLPLPLLLREDGAATPAPAPAPAGVLIGALAAAERGLHGRLQQSTVTSLLNGQCNESTETVPRPTHTPLKGATR